MDYSKSSRLMKIAHRYWFGFQKRGKRNPIVRHIMLFYTHFRKYKWSPYLQDVERFCFFIGHSRSGHSFIGQLLSAHPDMVISHELDAFQFIEPKISKERFYSLVLDRDQHFHFQDRSWTQGEYSVKLPNQWQAKFRKIKVIGDKKGGKTTTRIRNNPRLFDNLASITGVPNVIIYVIRNPYDNITTRHLRRPFFSLEAYCKSHFVNCANSQWIREREKVIDIHYEDFIKYPKKILRMLCKELGVECTKDYLEDCASIVFKKPSITRHKVHWPPELKKYVADEMKKYDFLKRYSFD